MGTRKLRKKTLKRKNLVAQVLHLRKRNHLLQKSLRKRKRMIRKIGIPNLAPVQVPNIKVIKVIGISIKAQIKKLAHQDAPQSLEDIPGHPQEKKSGVKKTEKRTERRTVLKKIKTEKKKEKKRKEKHERQMERERLENERQEKERLEK